MGNVADGKDLYGDASTWPPLPLKVRVTYNGQMKEIHPQHCSGDIKVFYNSPIKEMIHWGNGKWTTDSWTYAKHPRFNQKEFDKYALFQLIVEFKDASFAEGERQVLTHLSSLLDTQSKADVTFVVKNEKIGAHSAIVVSGSPVICAMLEEDKFKEGRTKTVQVEDIEPAVFKEMLRYLYTVNVCQLDAMTEPLFVAAHKYQIESLKIYCEQRLIKKLNVETVVHYLVLAHLYNAPQLLEASLMLMVKIKKELKARPEWKELIKNYPELFFLAANRIINEDDEPNDG